MKAEAQSLPIPMPLALAPSAVPGTPSDHKKAPRIHTGAGRGPAVSDCEAVFVEHLGFIERTVHSIARRYAVKPWDAEDFEGQVKLKLIADDYAILAKFEGRSKLTTFLTTVIHNQFRDFRIQRWGKWRPSAAAKRLGDLGVQLESLVYRDSFSASEAFHLLRERFEVSAPDDELEAMLAELKPRTTRRFESDAALAYLESPERADRALADRELSKTQARTDQALRRVLGSLEPEERLVLRMRFADALTIRAIAESLDLEPRRMYTRVQRLLLEIRRRLEALGVSCVDMADLLEWGANDLDVGLSELDIEAGARATDGEVAGGARAPESADSFQSR